MEKKIGWRLRREYRVKRKCSREKGLKRVDKGAESYGGYTTTEGLNMGLNIKSGLGRRSEK